ncbi:unnamed protein product, partial [Allacma fusca]
NRLSGYPVDPSVNDDNCQKWTQEKYRVCCPPW